MLSCAQPCASNERRTGQRGARKTNTKDSQIITTFLHHVPSVLEILQNLKNPFSTQAAVIMSHKIALHNLISPKLSFHAMLFIYFWNNNHICFSIFTHLVHRWRAIGVNAASAQTRRRRGPVYQYSHGWLRSISNLIGNNLLQIWFQHSNRFFESIQEAIRQKI